MELFQLLHISDLHFSTSNKFDSSILLDSLLDRVVEDNRNGLKPEIIIVSGDIARTGNQSEYSIAKQFFDRLLDCLNLDDNRLFLVPGNHDVNRSKYRPSNIPAYENMRKLNYELENNDYRNDLLKGMTEYFNFVEANYPHLRNNYKRLIPFVQSFTSESGRKVGLVGLNSAWMCRRSPDQGTIAIGEYQVKRAVDTLSNKDSHDLILYVFHHPLEWLWPVDRKICRKYFQDSIVLTGHLHDTEGGYIHDLDGRLYQFQAGASYIGSEDLNRYSHVNFDWINRNISLHFRKFANQERQWVLDGEKGRDGTAVFPLISPSASIDVDTEYIIKEDRQFNLYKIATKQTYSYISTRGMLAGSLERVKIYDLFIPLKLRVHATDSFTEQTSDIRSIKDVFEFSKRKNAKDFVLLGDPGSGKTTLLKYILVTLIDGSGRRNFGLNNDLIPFYAPLRELRDPSSELFIDFIKRVCSLSDYSISEFSLRNLFNDGRAIILLDGLDEIEDISKRILACRWIDKARVGLPNVRFIISSRYSGYSGSSQFKGNIVELSIQQFMQKEKQDFVFKWFKALGAVLHQGNEDGWWKEKGHSYASTIIEGINENENLSAIASNPLLLQLILLVYQHKAVLPVRRVDLYEECTDILLERWDMAKGIEAMLSGRQVRQILQPLALWLHKENQKYISLEKIRELISGHIMGTDIDIAHYLRNIADRSGVFESHNNSEYGFVHLSFQEYFAAEEIRDKRLLDLLLDHFTDNRWREVILLCLSLDNPSVIDDFMRNLIPSTKFTENLPLVIDALNESHSKPSKPFIDALDDQKLDIDTRSASIKILEKIGGPKVIQTIKSFTNTKYKEIASFAEEVVSRNISVVPKPSKQAEEIQSRAQIFLCYAREDATAVSELYDRLLSDGFNPWMDKKNILPGQQWELTLQNAIKRSDFFLSCLSPNSVRKRGVLQKEIKQALDIWETRLDSDIYLIPVRLQVCEVPDNLTVLQWVDLFDEDGYGFLIKSLYTGIERQST